MPALRGEKKAYAPLMLVLRGNHSILIQDFQEVQASLGNNFFNSGTRVPQTDADGACTPKKRANGCVRSLLPGEWMLRPACA